MQHKITALLLLLFCSMVALATPTPDNKLQKQLNSHWAFKENKGQVTDQYGTPRSDIHFQLNNNNTSVFVSRGRIQYQWNQTEKKEATRNDSMAYPAATAKVNTCRLEMELIGCRTDAVMIKEDRLPDPDIYYSAGLNGAKAYAYKKVTYKDIYPNIDWVLYINNDGLKYDFIVRPGGRVSDIQIAYKGAKDITINNGALIATTAMGSIKEEKPFSYNESDRRTVSSRFTLNMGIIGFEVGNYDGTLVIDPELRLDWSTYYGGSGAEPAQHLDYSFAGYSSYSITTITDNEGMVYMAGTTMSIDNIATTGAFQTTLSNNGCNAFLVKFNREGQRMWATYFGGQGGYINPDDGFNHGTVSGRGHSIACDTLGNIYMAGITWSNSGIATPGAYQTALNGVNFWPDLYLVKFHNDGTREWSTYFGNIVADEGGSVAVSKDGSRIYLAGASKASHPTNDTIATPGALFPSLTAQWSQYTGFLTCFNASGQKQWGTYIADVLYVDCTVYDIAMDKSGHLLLTGYVAPRPGDTNSIVTPGAFQGIYSGGVDAFVQKWDSMGNRIWGTYYGGNSMDLGYGIVCGENDEVYIAGVTLSTTGPLNGNWCIASPGSFQQSRPNPADFDNYLAKFSSTGQRSWGTYYGGTNPNGYDPVVGHHGGTLAQRNGKIYMLYTTLTDSLATPCAYRETNPGIYNNGTSFDAHLAIFDTSGNREYATYYGGLYIDFGLSVAIDSSKDGLNVYIAGTTYSPNGIASPNGFKSALQPQLSLQRDAFLTKFSIPVARSIIVPCFSKDSVQIIAGDTLGSNYLWNNNATGYSTWVKTTGTYIVHYQKPGGCPTTDTFAVNIYPMPVLTTQKKCIGQGEARVVVAEDNNNVYTYKWYRNGAVFAERQSGNGDELTGLNPGNYAIQILAGLCDTTLSFTIEALPEVILTISNDTMVAAGNSIQLWATGANHYQWLPEKWLDNPRSATPLARPQDAIIYTVTGYNEYGCKATASVRINLNEQLFIPNAFSPNGDGLNDEFIIANLGYHRLTAFRIYNRWGEEVYAVTDPAKGWNGNHKGKPADAGVYYYYISLFNAKEEEQVFKGELTLIR